MKSNLTVLVFCGGFLILFISFVLIAFHQTKPEVADHLVVTQSTLTSEEVLLLPPCHSFGEKVWLHHITGECYEIGTQGPCGESMTFYENPKRSLRTLGFCDCDDIVEVKSDLQDCEVIQRPLIYYPEKDQCYNVFSQGPCSEGMWLVLDDEGNAACRPNVCSVPERPLNEDVDDSSFWFSEGSQCYNTQTKGYCSTGEILKVVKDNWKPECRKNTNDDCIMTSEVSIATLECRPGNRLQWMKMCPRQYQ